jgi:ATP-binding cassette subfamily C (CFTR/MRP) protein 1
VLSRIVEGLSGAPTLRAYGMHADFNLKLLSGLDHMNGASFATVAIQRWLSLRQDAMTIFSLSVLGALVILNRHAQHPAVSGVALSLMINALQVIQVVVREWAEVESAMNATERLHGYASTIPLEEEDPGLESSAYKQPPKDWPTTGEVVLIDVCMRYRPDLPDSLHQLNLHIRAGDHVAIVGRTGAGKSSIINALFRFNPLSSGHIKIDGVDISQMPLTSLRRALAIVPQETDFFSGTVRSNLDPFGEYTEPELTQALCDAHLDKTASLTDAVQTGGSNLSVGQRQLLALARVMLRRSKILIFDEATSSLDTDTDELVQVAMRKSTQEKTVLCIAHRLRTVLWYDRVCVMDEGKIVELASPAELWDNPEGSFRRMCDQAGITRAMIESASQSSTGGAV